MQWMRKDNNSGLRDLITYIGRDHITMVEAGSYAGESASVFLATGKVDKIYCVDPWKPGYDPADPASKADNLLEAEREFDRRFAGDNRVVKVKSTIQEAVSGKLIPEHVDLVYVDACSLYAAVVSDLRAVRGMCDILAGHDIGAGGGALLRAIRDALGRFPEKVFSDTSWVVRDPADSRISADTAYIYVSDNNPVQIAYLRNASSSLRRNVPSARVFVLTGGRTAVPDQVAEGVKTVRVDSLFEQVYGAGAIDRRVGTFRWPALTFARLLAPLVPELQGFNRFVYMDNDTEVISPCFSEVEHISTGSLISGTADYPDLVPDYCKRIADKTGIAVKEDEYINTGVLVIERSSDTTSWVELCRRAFDLETKHCFYLGDQDAINAVFTPGKVSSAFSYLCDSPVAAPAGTYLCHFAGPHKGVYLKGSAGVDPVPKASKASSTTVRSTGRPLAECADKAYLLCFTGYKDRAASVLADIHRIGVSPEQIWQFPTPFDKHFSDSVPHIGHFDSHPGWANNWFGHYRAMKTAYELGASSVLIMEDDCRFLQDKAKVDEIASDMPADFDLALFDHFYPSNWGEKGKVAYSEWCSRRVNKYWHPFDSGLFSAACYMLSRRAMARLIWLHESVIDPSTPNRMMSLTDFWHNRGVLGRDMKLYFCTPNCAIQRNPDTGETRLSGTAGINSVYRYIGLDLSAYAQ